MSNLSVHPRPKILFGYELDCLVELVESVRDLQREVVGCIEHPQPKIFFPFVTDLPASRVPRAGKTAKCAGQHGNAECGRHGHEPERRSSTAAIVHQSSSTTTPKPCSKQACARFVALLLSERARVVAR